MIHYEYATDHYNLTQGYVSRIVAHKIWREGVE